MKASRKGSPIYTKSTNRNLNKQKRTMGVTSGSGAAYTSGAIEFTICFVCVGLVAQSLVFRVVFYR
jgi:hypothetical protein